MQILQINCSKTESGFVKIPFAPIFTAIVLFVAIQSANASDLTIDALTFKADSGRTYLELHIDLPRNSLTHVQTDSGWFGAARFEVLVQKDTVTLARDDWRLEDYAVDPEAVASGLRIVDARIYQMRAGLYGISVSVTDSISGSTVTQSRSVDVPFYPDDRFSFSDLQFALQIVEGSVHPRFDRGGFSIIPNPRKLFAPPTPIVYYLEIYPKTSGGEQQFLINPTLLSNTRAHLKSLPQLVRQGETPFSVIDTIPVSDLPGDTYFFQLEIVSGNDTILKTGKFHIYSPDHSEPSPVSALSLIDSATTVTEFEQVSFLLSTEEVSQAKNLNPAEKAEFLKRFWQRYDDDPSTPEVPLRRVFLARIREADDRWTNSRSAGHMSDRGRIYVVHGEPDDREIHTLDLHAKPYEVWTYDSLQGGVVFAFVDRSALGEFTLVHSTFRGEIFNPEWYDNYVIKSGISNRK